MREDLDDLAAVRGEDGVRREADVCPKLSEHGRASLVAREVRHLLPKDELECVVRRRRRQRSVLSSKRVEESWEPAVKWRVERAMR